MTAFAATRPVNPPGTDLVLTEAQVWKGLEHKARNPSLFVPAITHSEVIKDEGNKVTRVVQIHNGERQTEEIEAHPNAAIYFDFVDKPVRVLNILSHGPQGELLLTYSFAPEVPGSDPNTVKTVAEKNEMVGKVIEHTVDVIRELVKSGKL
ncbi:SRPBCC family protein [Sporobolomyces koalae]|uniref:SRPBCC family protein n=1 Tax=Sporobolomyces koalae TaxID=500713 RepID=UPI003174D54A